MTRRQCKRMLSMYAKEIFLLIKLAEKQSTNPIFSLL